MVRDESGLPLDMFGGVTGCPKIQGRPAYKGGGDCFTLAQLMAQG